MPSVMGICRSLRNLIQSVMRPARKRLVKGPAYDTNAAASSISPVSTSYILRSCSTCARAEEGARGRKRGCASARVRVCV